MPDRFRFRRDFQAQMLVEHLFLKLVNHVIDRASPCVYGYFAADLRVRNLEVDRHPVDEPVRSLLNGVDAIGLPVENDLSHFSGHSQEDEERWE